MYTFFKDFLNYNQYANQLYISYFTDKGFDAEKGIKIFSHIINAQHIWLARIKGEAPMFDVWEIHVINSFEKVNEANYQKALQLLDKEKDLNKIIDYKNSKGTDFQNSIQNILLHIVNHSTYHRGQLATLIREAGIQPPATDYIYYKRDLF